MSDTGFSLYSRILADGKHWYLYLLCLVIVDFG
jgi:hypothetical protein